MPRVIIAIIALCLALSATLALGPTLALAQSDDWEQVPAETEQRAPAENATGLPAPTNSRGAMACRLVSALVEEAARLRDKGVSEQSQLDSIDHPSGKLYRLTLGAMLSADTSGALRAGMHREIAYVYEHPDMTPAQLAASADASCGNVGQGQTEGASSATPTPASKSARSNK